MTRLHNLAVLMLACGAAGCDSAPLSPTELPPAEPLTVDEVVPSVGWLGSTVEIRGTGFTPRTTVVIGNAPARIIEVPSSWRITVITPAHDEEAVDVTVTNPSGERAILASGYTSVAVTLTPDKTDARAGDFVTVTWSASSGRAEDWVGLFSVGSPLMPWAEWGFEWQYTDGATSGTWRLRLQAYPPGQYEFRYALGGNSSGWAAHSVPVTIR